jgi:hypothetical protein
LPHRWCVQRVRRPGRRCRARPYLVTPCAPLRHRGGGHSAILAVPSMPDV